jgi:Fe-S-cluster containining protein
MAQYNCLKCPGFCCSYEIIPLKKRDVQRLADYFGISFRVAKKRYTVARGDEEYSMRRKADTYFGHICQFFDTEERRCTIYKGRPGICREYPGNGRCGYYDFLSHERRIQEDPELVALTTNGRR